MRFSSRLANDEITTRGYKTLTFIKCTIIMIAELMVMSSLRSSQRLDDFDMVGFGMVLSESVSNYVILSDPLIGIMLCDNYNLIG
jgi:hypothetical protein